MLYTTLKDLLYVCCSVSLKPVHTVDLPLTVYAIQIKAAWSGYTMYMNVAVCT